MGNLIPSLALLLRLIRPMIEYARYSRLRIGQTSRAGRDERRRGLRRMGGAKRCGGQMLKESVITNAVAELKYERIKRFTYRAIWSTSDVEHLLFFSLWGTPKNFLAADFGVRNKSAEAFGTECVHAFGGPIYQLMKNDEETDCFMKFSLGKLARWEPRSSLKVREVSGTELTDKIKTDVHYRLVPLISRITSLDDLLSLLLKDAEPFSWMYVNSAIRVAQIVYLSRVLGMDLGEIRVSLRPFGRELVSSIPKGADPASYIDRVLEHVEAKGVSALGA